MTKKTHNQNNDFDLALAVGKLTGLTEGINDRLDKMNGSLADITIKVNRHEVFFGKIGVMITVFGVFISTISTLAVGWIKDKIL